MELLSLLYAYSGLDGVVDELRWLGLGNGVFSVSSFYRILKGEMVASFPWQMVWYTGLPPKVSFLCVDGYS